MQVDSASSVRPRRKRFRLRGTSKVAAVFVVVVGGGWALWAYGVGAYLGRIQVTPPMPGSVTLLALAQGAGYRATIVDKVVQLRPTGEGSFDASSSNLGVGGGSGSGSPKEPNLPMGDLVGTLGGDSAAATRLVMELNRLEPEQMEKETDPESGWPTTRIYWKADEIKKALGGDPILQKKLIADLNIELDGTPIPQLSYRSLQNGIIVETPATLPVTIQGKLTQVPVTISMPYRPKLMVAIMRQADATTSKRFASDPRLALYTSMSQDVLSGKTKKEDVRAALEKLISPEYVQPYIEKAARIVRASTVVLANGQIESAGMSTDSVNGQTNYDLNLNLTSDGRMRLWKYSHEHHGDQLLLVSNGAAIAAPIIESDLMTSQVTIGQMQDQQLVQDAVDSINQNTGDQRAGAEGK